MKILLADDSGYFLEKLKKMVSIKELIEILGPYKNGLETLAAIKFQKPGLVILDNKMPGLCGLYVLEEIRKEDKVLKFIIYTLYPTEYNRKIAFHLGKLFLQQS